MSDFFHRLSIEQEAGRVARRLLAEFRRRLRRELRRSR